MPRRDQIGDWRCVERAAGREHWEHPEHAPVTLQHEPTAPPGERWAWATGEQQGRARTNGDAFSAALVAAGAPIPRRPSGPSGKHRADSRNLYQPPTDFAAQDAAAESEGVTWADWIRDAARRKLEISRGSSRTGGRS